MARRNMSLNKRLWLVGKIDSFNDNNDDNIRMF